MTEGHLLKVNNASGALQSGDMTGPGCHDDLHRVIIVRENQGIVGQAEDALALRSYHAFVEVIVVSTDAPLSEAVVGKYSPFRHSEVEMRIMSV